MSLWTKVITQQRQMKTTGGPFFEKFNNERWQRVEIQSLESNTGAYLDAECSMLSPIEVSAYWHFFQKNAAKKIDMTSRNLHKICRSYV
jgi:hypothetical protein